MITQTPPYSVSSLPFTPSHPSSFSLPPSLSLSLALSLSLSLFLSHTLAYLQTSAPAHSLSHSLRVAALPQLGYRTRSCSSAERARARERERERERERVSFLYSNLLFNNFFPTLFWDSSDPF
ncbi:unnamed protein product [Arctogadus glacialis]